MAFYFRKSIKVGPFRFNLSKSGVGMSTGVKGLRFGTGPKGHYIFAGVNGLYYQQKLGNNGPRQNTKSQATLRSDEKVYFYTSDGIKMWSIDTSATTKMNENSIDPILEDINEKATKYQMAIVAPLILLVPAILAAYVLKNDVMRTAIPALLVLIGATVGWWYDIYARTAVLMYDFDAPSYHTYNKIRQSFEEMQKASNAWHVPSAGKVETLLQWKKNSGASTIVERKSISLEFTLPSIVNSNLVVPTIPVGKQRLYFFPDRLLIEDGDQFSSVNYGQLKTKTQNSRFIEDGRVPHDAERVGETWKYLNKKGGPDKRFNDNQILPICLYEDLLMESDSGLRELIELSKIGPLDGFASALREFANSPAIISLIPEAK
jgi:Protein of unknown function (DUF4236)